MVQGAIIGIAISLLFTYFMKTSKYQSDESIQRFTIAFPKSLGRFGIVFFLLFGVMLILSIISGTDWDYLSIILIVLIFFCPSLFLVIIPFRSVYSIVIDGNIIHYVFLCKERHTWEIKQIHHVDIIPNLGARVYMMGDEKRKAFDVNYLATGYENFLKRMEDEHIIIEQKDI